MADVDVGALLAWALVGLTLFSRRPQPPMREVLGEVRRMILALLMERTGGNISRVAAALSTSRRAVRDQLETAGPYELDVWNIDAMRSWSIAASRRSGPASGRPADAWEGGGCTKGAHVGIILQ